MKIITIGGATQDIFLHYEGTDFMTITKKHATSQFMLFESGEKKEIETIRSSTGGGATNSAVSFKRLGFNVACFCTIGDDQAGKAIIETLQKESVDTSLIQVQKGQQSGQSFIINSQQGESTIFAFRGTNSSMPADKIPYESIQKSNYVYITSLSNESANHLPKIASFARKNNVAVAINPGVSQLAKGTRTLKESLAFIDILILNSAEAQIFMLALCQSDEIYKNALECARQSDANGINLGNPAPYLLSCPLAYEDRFFSIRQFFIEILKMGPKIVVVTNGQNGVYVATHHEVLFHPSLKIKVVNTVGAGDAFGSCFVGSLLLNYPVEQALRHGIINSASVLERPGAKTGLLSQDLLQKHAAKLDLALLQRSPL